MKAEHIRPIRSDADLERSLARIEELMGVSEGPALEELEVLSQIVQVYEAKHHPVGPPSPIDAIKFRVEQRGLSRRDLEPYIGSSGKVSEVLSGKVPLTLKMIRALHKGLGIPAEILIGEGQTLQEDELHEDASRFPLREMASEPKAWFRPFGEIKGREGEALQWLAARAGVTPRQVAVHCRKNDEARQNAKMDVHALQAWCLHVMGVANEAHLPGRYDKDSITGEFLRNLATLSRLPSGPRIARDLLAEQGIHLVIAPHLKHTYLDGAAMLLPNGSPVVALTLRYDRIDNFWHVLLHELAHVKNDLKGDCAVVYDDFNLPSAESISEKRADREATDALLPPDHRPSLIGMERMETEGVLALARRARVHPAIVAGHIRHETGNYRKFARLLGHGEVKKQLED